MGLLSLSNAELIRTTPMNFKALSIVACLVPACWYGIKQQNRRVSACYGACLLGPMNYSHNWLRFDSSSQALKTEE
jgi:hypothetical protein